MGILYKTPGCREIKRKYETVQDKQANKCENAYFWLELYWEPTKLGHFLGLPYQARTFVGKDKIWYRWGEWMPLSDSFKDNYLKQLLTFEHHRIISLEKIVKNTWGLEA